MTMQSKITRSLFITTMLMSTAPLNAQTSTNSENRSQELDQFEIEKAKTSLQSSLESLGETKTRNNKTLSDAVKLQQSSQSEILGGSVPAQLIVESDFGKSNAKISFSTASDHPSGFGEQSFALTLNAPLTSDGSRADFVTESGLPGKFGVDLSLSISLSPTREIFENQSNMNLTREIAKLQGNAKTICEANYTEYLERMTIADPKNVLQRKWNSLSEYCPIIIEQLENQTPKDVARMLGESEERAKIIIDELSSNLLYLTDEAIKKPYFMMNVAGSWRLEDYKFRDPMTLAKGKKRRSDFTAGLAVGYLPRLDSKVLFGGSVEYRNKFKAESNTIRCPTGSTDPSIECFEAAFKPPKQMEQYILSGLARYLNVDMGLGGEIKGSWDAKNNIWGAEIPIYFIANKDNQLNAGVRFKWASGDGEPEPMGGDKDVWNFGIFVSKPFDFLKL